MITENSMNLKKDASGMSSIYSSILNQSNKQTVKRKRTQILDTDNSSHTKTLWRIF